MAFPAAGSWPGSAALVSPVVLNFVCKQLASMLKSTISPILNMSATSVIGTNVPIWFARILSRTLRLVLMIFLLSYCGGPGLAVMRQSFLMGLGIVYCGANDMGLCAGYGLA